jgi:hypothetical protein
MAKKRLRLPPGRGRFALSGRAATLRLVQTIEIKPGNVWSVATALKSGKLIAIDNDVQGVANDLHEIDAGFRLRYDPGEDVYLLSHEGLQPDGSVEEKFVSSFEACDQRIVQRAREISAPSYDYVGELDRLEAKAERDKVHEFSEKIGPHAEKLAWALRQDLGRHEHPRTKTATAFVPADVPKGD